jgi:putative sugar O-methyltransferase
MGSEIVARFAKKITRAWSEGKLRRKARSFLYRKLIVPIRLQWRVARALAKLDKSDRRLSVADGFCDHRRRSDHHRSSPEHLHRIIKAYKASKKAQEDAAPPFRIRGLWHEWIQANFQRLINALSTEDTYALSVLLDNFNREQFTVGLGTGYENFIKYRGLNTRRYYLRTIWCDYRDKLLAHGFNLQQAHSPLVGNPAGLLLNDDVIQIDTFRHIYHAIEMQDWLRDCSNSIIVEIGGGYGDQAYQTIHMCEGRIAKYVVFDIPEVAAIASYFLLSALPNKRIRLFGEGSVSIECCEEYDVAVFPHYASTSLPDCSVDLFHNSCSFTEMDSASSSEYLRIIERSCKRFFSHVNHELPFEFQNHDGSKSVNIIGSRLIPDPKRFKRLFKKPRVFELPEDRLAGATAFEYLYTRVNSAEIGDR